MAVEKTKVPAAVVYGVAGLGAAIVIGVVAWVAYDPYGATPRKADPNVPRVMPGPGGAAGPPGGIRPDGPAGGTGR